MVECPLVNTTCIDLQILYGIYGSWISLYSVQCIWILYNLYISPSRFKRISHGLSLTCALCMLYTNTMLITGVTSYQVSFGVFCICVLSNALHILHTWIGIVLRHSKFKNRLVFLNWIILLSICSCGIVASLACAILIYQDPYIHDLLFLVSIPIYGASAVYMPIVTIYSYIQFRDMVESFDFRDDYISVLDRFRLYTTGQCIMYILGVILCVAVPFIPRMYMNWIFIVGINFLSFSTICTFVLGVRQSYIASVSP